MIQLKPIGICPAQLLEVRGLDALDGTPVLDPKPYLERGDAISNTHVGVWVRQYWTSL